MSSGLTVEFGIDRARTEAKDAIHDPAERDSTMPVKLDASAQAHIEKHR